MKIKSVWQKSCLVGALLVSGATPAAAVDPPAAPVPPAAAPPSGSFLSSLKQAFSQDFDQEVVRGHFDVGTPPDTHRYYCMLDPKTGRREINGVAGELVPRHDGMTGIRGGAVSFYSCATAEAAGTLVTAGYELTASAAAAVARAATPPTPIPSPSPARVAAPAATAAANGDVRAVFNAFLRAQTAHDRTALAAVLLDSPEFVMIRHDGVPLWGVADALNALQSDGAKGVTLTPRSDELRVSNVAPDVAILVTPVTVTPQGAQGPATPASWVLVFVKTSSAWRIGSILTSP